MTRKRTGNGKTLPFVMTTAAMIESRRKLTLVARRVLDRLELEHLRHRGKANGHLAVSYNQLLEYAERNTRKAVAAAIKELVCASLVEVTPGRWNAGNPSASRYRLTYLPVANNRAPDDGGTLVPKRELDKSSEKGTRAGSEKGTQCTGSEKGTPF